MKKQFPLGVKPTGTKTGRTSSTSSPFAEKSKPLSGLTPGGTCRDKAPSKAADRSAGLSAFAPDAPFYNPVLRYEGGRLVNSLGYPYVTLTNCSVAFAEELARRWNAYNTANPVRPTPKEKK